jgi:mRNA-degrading endonuclease RelE of RelBE toxin-antitoxin system
VTGKPGAPFEVRWAAPARRALRRLPEKVAAAAIECIYGPLAGDPRRVHVLAIDHRADVYRRG